MKQITQIALFSVTLFGFLAFGNHTLSAENQSNSDTSENQRQHIEKENKNSRRILNLHKSWIRNRERTAKQQQLKKVSKKQTSEQLSADTSDTSPAAVDLGIQTPELPKPFYADTYSIGSRLGMDFGVQTKDGSIYTLQIEKEVTEEGISRSIGGSAEFDLSKTPSFFTQTRDVLLFIPKKIGAGVIYLGRGIKHLLWW